MAQVRDDAVANVADEPQQVVAVHGGVAEARSLAVPVRVQAAAADLQHRAVQALRGQGGGADLPGDRSGVVQRAVEAAREDMKTGVGGAGIRGTERVELFDGAIGIDYGERAGHQSQPLNPAGLAEDELDELTEQADPRFLARRGVPPVEDADQPVSVTRPWRRGTPVGVRQQQVDRRGAELEECLVGSDRVIAGVDRAQEAAVAGTEFR